MCLEGTTPQDRLFIHCHRRTAFQEELSRLLITTLYFCHAQRRIAPCAHHHRNHRHAPVPHGQGRYGQDHFPAPPARRVVEAYGGARAHGHRGHQRRRRDHSLLLPTAFRPVRARQHVQPRATPPHQAQTPPDTQSRPRGHRRNQYGTRRLARCRRHGPAYAAAQQPALWRRAVAHDRRLAAVAARGEGQRAGVAATVLRHALLLRGAGITANLFRDNRTETRLSPKRRGVYFPAQPYPRGQGRYRHAR